MANITKEERAKRELEARHETGEVLENPRIPVTPLAANAPEPFTPGAAALPMGTAGHAAVDNAEETVRAGEVPNSPQPMVTVRFKRGYFPVSGGAKIPVGEERDLPQVDGRLLIEAGIAEYVNHYISEA